MRSPRRARISAAGNYRWVADVMDRSWCSPIRPNKEARELAADAFEQMGYGSENAPWRNSYLLAAQKLRAGPPAAQRPTPAITPEVLHVMPAGGK